MRNINARLQQSEGEVKYCDWSAGKIMMKIKS